MSNLDKKDLKNWLQSRQDYILRQLNRWCSINTHSFNISGINEFLKVFLEDAKELNADIQHHDLANFSCISLSGKPEICSFAPAITLTKRPNAKKKVLLCIHSDTVYAVNDGFLKCELLDHNTLKGPGVADAKGGLQVLLTGLLAYERFCPNENLGWTILLVPDEEIGSMGSFKLTQNLAKNHHIGLVFEPALPDGNLVSSRPGSIVIRLMATGKAAHAGRELEKGINAITALSHLITHINTHKHRFDGNFNIGVIKGGTAVNQVPDYAVCELNFRSNDLNKMQQVKQLLNDFISDIQGLHMAEFSIHHYCERPPKILDHDSYVLYKQLQICAKQQGLNISWKSSFGVSDANYMSSIGLATLDTLGPVGGNLHSHQEYVKLSSILERSELLCRFLHTF